MDRFRHEALAVVLQVRGLDQQEPRLQVLLKQRHRDPFAGAWALPSGPVGAGESLGESVRRHLAALMQVRELAHLEQLETRGEVGRDPKQRTIATAYLGLVPWTSEPELPPRVGWHPVDALPEIAFDHAEVVRDGVRRLRSKLSYTNIAFALAPQRFTLAELRDMYAAALDRKVSVTNLQRILLRRGQLESTGEQRTQQGRGGGRPAGLFRFTESRLRVTDQFATLRPGGERSARAKP
ncbi:NUDIX hydrolase [Enemella dayhoffiae]|uniref:NUDIX hydrolase n=1 Tax=Enemella dayhoffiae TaxID=2016507 RepID=A0A255GPI9_9ACTN|nr:NUDIX hydrolase [Enemella dayhoffiae]